MVREVLRPRAIQRPCVLPGEIVTKPARFFTCDDALHMGGVKAPLCNSEMAAKRWRVSRYCKRYQTLSGIVYTQNMLSYDKLKDKPREFLAATG